MEKLYSSKTCLKMAGGENASPTSLLDPPLPARITMSFTTTPTSRFGFSMMCGKFCHSCFECRYCTCTVWTLHLKNKSSIWKGGVSTPDPLLGAPLVLTSTSMMRWNVGKKLQKSLWFYLFKAIFDSYSPCSEINFAATWALSLTYPTMWSNAGKKHLKDGAGTTLPFQ